MKKQRSVNHISRVFVKFVHCFWMVGLSYSVQSGLVL